MIMQIKAAKLFDVFSLCLSEESVFAGSLGKLVVSRPSSTGYLHSLAELKVGSIKSVDQYPVINASTSDISNMRTLVQEIQYSEGQTYENYELPRMPPWFESVGSHKLYEALVGILRLVGLSLISGNCYFSSGVFFDWILIFSSVLSLLFILLLFSLCIKQFVVMKCLYQK